MRVVPAVGVVVALIPLAAASFGGATPTDAAEASRRAEVVARVGAEGITVGELEARLSAMPVLQLALYGKSAPEVRARVLEDEVLREKLLVQAARAKGLDKAFDVAPEVRRTLSEATLRAVRKEVGAPESLSAEDVARYYEGHRSRFEQPERILVWRILCATREEAESVLAAAKNEPDAPTFQALAREHSLDKATHLRGGNLGFLAPDGTSSDVGLKTDPALVRAAATVKDGELVARPVEEGAYFAVVWRRGTVAARRRTLEDAAPIIRESLHRERVELAVRTLLERLRREQVREVDESLLLTLDVAPDDVLRVGSSLPAPPASSASARPSAR